MHNRQQSDEPIAAVCFQDALGEIVSLILGTIVFHLSFQCPHLIFCHTRPLLRV